MIPDVVHSQERAVLDGLNQFDGALTDQDGNGMGRGGGTSGVVNKISLYYLDVLS